MRVGASRDDLPDGALAHALVERFLVEHVPGSRSRLASGGLHQLDLRPRDLVVVDELLAEVIEDPREAAVDLRQAHKLGLAEVEVGHVAPVELVEALREPGAALEPMPEPVARAPGVGAQPQRPRRPHEPLDELGVTLKSAGRQQERPSGNR